MRIQLFTFLWLALVVVGLNSGCGNTGAVKGIVIEGTLEGASGLEVFLDKFYFDNTNEILDKMTADQNGSFSFAFKEGLDHGVYRIRIGAQRMFLPLQGTEKKVEINGQLAQMGSFQVDVSGSPCAEQYMNYLQKLQSREITPKEVMAEMENNEYPVMAMMLTLQSSGGEMNASNIQLHQVLQQKMASLYPNSKYTEDYANQINASIKKIQAQKAAGNIAVGQPAPDIALEDPNGNIRNLSDLKGKVVLLDFWASWCRPCRMANPHVVETYKKYRDQGFTVYSVSLDGIHPRQKARLQTPEQEQKMLASAKQKWMAAIKKDNLIWDHHVSDLQHWGSQAAKMYGVRSIPRTFLIDREGNIALVGVNPLRDNLDAEIEKLL